MNTASFICSLILFVIVCNAASPQVRYINSIPQFGSSAFSAATPQTTLFPSVSPSSISSYSSLAPGSWNFFSTFNHKVSAGSDQYDASNDKWYTAYTAQTTQKKLKNFLLEDSTPLTTGTNAAVRIVNLLQFNFAINASATSSSSHNFNWADISYGSATTYTDIPAGTYSFDWSSASLSKRNIEQSNCTFGCGGPFDIVIRKTYTVYVLPTTTIVVSDGTTSTSKRETRSRRAIQKSNTLSERLFNKKEINETPEEVNNNDNNNDQSNESIEELDQSN